MSSVGRREAASGPAARALQLLDRIDYRLAETDEDRQTIYRLRYRAYLQEGTIEPNRERIVTDRFDDLPNSWIFGVHLDGVLVSSLRITIASPDYPDCPSMGVFRDWVEPQLAQGKLIVDPTRFVAEPSNRFPELPYMTLRLAYVACTHFNADIGLATVRSEHQAFYRKVFLHEPVCEARHYPGLTKPIALMAVDFQAMRAQVFARYPFLMSSVAERQALFGRNTDRQSPSLQSTGCVLEGVSLMNAGCAKA